MIHLRGALILVFFSSMIAGNISAQLQNDPLHKSANREILNFYDSRAKDFVSKNLNRFALERKHTYDHLLDSLYNFELKDTLSIIQNGYLSNSKSNRSINEAHSKKIALLSAQKTNLENTYSALIKKAVLSFVLWLVIVLLLLMFRKNKMKKAKVKFDSAKVQLESLEVSAINANKLNKDLLKMKEPFKKLNMEYAKLNTLLVEGAIIKNAPVEWPEISAKSTSINSQIEKEEKLLFAISDKGNIESEDLVKTDINNLCETYFEIAYRGIQKTENFNCHVSRDFEKKLPLININPDATGKLILNILTNAFQSVKAKNDKGIKGYEPKVSISTRILPRFLQIRIKDNGTGMNETVLQNATKEFFSTRDLTEGSGLGLYFANNIISELHKGEIKIESEEGNSTDVYIKFFI